MTVSRGGMSMVVMPVGSGRCVSMIVMTMRSRSRMSVVVMPVGSGRCVSMIVMTMTGG